MILLFAGLSATSEAGVVRVATGPVVADGFTQADVRLWTDTPGSKLKIAPQAGVLGAVTVSPDGVVVARWTPAAVAAEGTVPWTISVGKEVFTVGIPVVPPVAAKMTLTVDPPVVKQGEVASLKVTGAPGDLPVLVRASIGTLGVPVRETDGWRVSWTAPKTPAPIVGVFSVADASYPEQAFTTGVARIPARQTVKVEVPAGSKSVLVVGETKIGPVPAVGTNATFEVEVDPNARTGTLEITRADGTTESRGVILASGSAALAWIPGPLSFAGQSVAVLRLAAVGADGGMLIANAPRVTASAGTIRDLKVEGSLWRVDLALPPGGGEVVVNAEFAGVKAEVKLHSNPLTAARITAGTLATDAADVELKAPVASSLEVREGKGTPKAVGGETVIRLAPTADRVSAVAHPVVVPSNLSPRRVAVWADTPVISADGASVASLTVVVLDAAGAPLKDAEVAVRLVGGDGAIGSEARTDAHGLAHLTYTSGKTAGPVGIRFDVGKVWTEFPLFQAAGPSGPSLALPLDPVAAAWRDATAWSTVYREGKAPAAHPAIGVAVAPAPAPAPAPAAAAAAPAAGSPAPAPVDAPAAAAPKAPKAPRTPAPSTPGSFDPWVAVALTDSHGGYSLEGPGTGGLVSSAVVPTPPLGFLGLEGQVDWPVAEGGFGAISPIARVHLRGEPHDVAGEQAISPQYDLQGGLRWHASPLGNVALDVSLGAHALSAVGFRNVGDAVEVFSVNLVGVRPAVGAAFDAGTVALRAEAGLTLGPAPIAGGLEVAAAFGDGSVRPRVSLGLDHRGFEVEGAKLRQTRGVLGLGIVWGP